MIPIRRLSISAALLTGLMSTNGLAQEAAAKTPMVRTDVKVRPGDGLILARPDLVVSLSCNAQATAGTNLPVVVKVTNKGTVKAIGTNEGPTDKAYMIDLVWSADSVIPMKIAIQPVYQGLTREDFVEDMLVLGGRISNTQSILPGQSVTYNLPAYLPRNMAPAVYWLGAYVDSISHVTELREANNTTSTKVLVGTSSGTNTTVPAGVDYWVMPWAVGNTPLYSIKSTGLTDYTDGLSGMLMNDAPFGGHLGFRHGYDSRIPTAQIAYYRWLYRPIASAIWHEFSETIGVHYMRQVGASVTFPVYVLGPKNVNGNTLYEFRPKQPPQETGTTNTWPTSDWFGDIYSGLLNSPTLAEGTYEFKLEIFNDHGVKTVPGPTTFNFLAPLTTTSDGTVTTGMAPAASIVAGGYVFKLHIDNRRCAAVIDAPSLAGGSATDACGFLVFNPASTAKVHLAFHATHPAKFARFRFDVYRAASGIINATEEVAATTVGDFSGDGSGNFQGDLTRSQLLQSCPKGAFAELLYLYPKATTGWHQRITAYDAQAVRAFALAPE